MKLHNEKKTLTDEEKKIIANLLQRGCKNQDIQYLINKNRSTTINFGRISEIKNNKNIIPATNEDTDFFLHKKDAVDQYTGLNLYDDERLIRARESMILAVNLFNNPSIRFKTEVFSVLANIAWTYLLHEYFIREKETIEDNKGKTFSLSIMLKRNDCPLSIGIKKNLNAIIKIRHAVEHRLLRKTDQRFICLFQACCLNFDKIMCDLFGKKLSLQSKLSIALQFSKRNLEQIEILDKYDIPPHIEALDKNLEKNLTNSDKEDTEYKFGIIYTIRNTSKSNKSIEFISPESQEGQEIHNVLEKVISADTVYPYKPKKICQLIKEKTNKDFTLHNHTQAMYKYKARPKGTSTERDSTYKKWCCYHKTHNDYTYSEKWISHLTKIVLNDDCFNELKKYKDNK